MTRLATIIVVVIATLAAAGVGALAWADDSSSEQLPGGARIAAVDVGGLTRDEALARIRRRVGAALDRPVHIQLGDRIYSLSARRAGVRGDLGAAVDRAYAAGREGSFVARGWRRLTGAAAPIDVAVAVDVDRNAVRQFVAGIEREQALDPVDAALKLTLTSVTVTPPRAGRRLAAREALIARLIRRLTSRTSDRMIRARTVEVAARLTDDSVFDAQPIAVTVSRDERRARVFKRGELVKTYTVAIGSQEFPTPTGRFMVQTMQRNPAWNVPQSEWAGDLAGETIPGGDPRNPLIARWIGFAGSVGFHGTNSSGSLGTAASHGCVRMDPDDVIDLFERVTLGTPVLVA